MPCIALLESPLSRLKMIVDPALRAEIPVLFVVSPTNPKLKLPALYMRVARQLDELVPAVNRESTGLHFWPAYLESWGDSIPFIDLTHMGNRDHFTRVLLEKVIDFGLRSDEEIRRSRDGNSLARLSFVGSGIEEDGS